MKTQVLPFEAIRATYEWKKNEKSIQVCHEERFGPWPWSGKMTIKCDEETAFEMGRRRGWLDAIEEVYGL